MPSEYDFLLPYSRRARRAGRAALIAGVFGLGVACTALVIALPMRPAERQATNATDSRGKEATAKPVAAPSALADVNRRAAGVVGFGLA